MMKTTMAGEEETKIELAKGTRRGNWEWPWSPAWNKQPGHRREPHPPPCWRFPATPVRRASSSLESQLQICPMDAGGHPGTGPDLLHLPSPPSLLVPSPCLLLLLLLHHMKAKMSNVSLAFKYKYNGEVDTHWRELNKGRSVSFSWVSDPRVENLKSTTLMSLNL